MSRAMRGLKLSSSIKDRSLFACIGFRELRVSNLLGVFDLTSSNHWKSRLEAPNDREFPTCGTFVEENDLGFLGDAGGDYIRLRFLAR